MSQVVGFHRVTAPELRLPDAKWLCLLPHSWRFSIEQRRLERWFGRLFDGAEDHEKLDEIRDAYGLESARLRAREAKVLTSYFIRKARQLRLQVPQYGAVFLQEPDALEDWEIFLDVGHYLKAERLAELRNAVWEAQKARRDRWAFLATSLTGVIGALTGLASILQRC